jgi:hypothetical protein
MDMKKLNNEFEFQLEKIWDVLTEDDDMKEYFDKITEMNLWYFINVKKKRGQKRRRRRWRFIEKEFRPLLKYFRNKYKKYSRYVFRRYLKKMKKIKKLGWIEYVKKCMLKKKYIY